MKFSRVLLSRIFFANILHFVVGTGTDAASPPTCATRCMVDSMFVTQCLDTNCLCHQQDYQKSLFQCLYSQCDSSQYGPALSHTISVCIDTGAEIYMVAPGAVGNELLRAREADYLAGRPVQDVPGLHLRQESITGTATVTTTMTFSVTVTGAAADAAAAAAAAVTAAPIPTPFLDSNGNDTGGAGITTTSAYRPWVVTSAGANNHSRASSFAGLVLWIALLLMQDYWTNGYWN
ncbi:hypothetical protein F4779DRAFT_217407 [Xylariaceae sp. FL0662B]|nr:hypothetical protein F4779DRAFT_217407 [Xylariaceae sp. FL0662B]